MEGITRIVSESLARHGCDRPLDYRRLHWSRWFRCESHHSLLVVPSKPGVFALAEEIADFNPCSPETESRTPEGGVARRMLAVTQFTTADDMAYVLDRMLSSQNPMHVRLLSGHYFVRFVVIEDEAQRRSICGALSQWLQGEKASGIGTHFAASLELTENRVVMGELSGPFRTYPESVGGASPPAKERPAAAPQLDSEAAGKFHCPAPFPSGF
jgi:hypothetical protein